MLLDELMAAALLGTRGSTQRLPALPDELAATLPARTGDVESQLLDAAAALTLYSRAGATPHLGIDAAAPAPPDFRPECSSRAADLLAQVLDAGLAPLLAESLELFAAAQVRPPHRLLPSLLEAAASRRALQPAVNAIVDERGRWLMQFNARWRFAGPSRESLDEIWQLGNRSQRAEALRNLRASDPAAAREWIAKTWADDAADDRAEWIACLLDGLSDADEEFLEARLDDRSSRVRAAAADLLARLPNSRLVARMIARVAPLISFLPGEPGAGPLRKRAAQPRLQVALPDAFDPALQRDGVSEKPSEKLGPKQWWLLQMLGAAPLDYWTQAFGATPAELIAAAPEEFAAILLRGWGAAFARRPSPDWTAPLVVAAENIPWDVATLQAVPPSQRPAVLAALLRRSKFQPAQLAGVLAGWRPLDEAVSLQFLAGSNLQTAVACDAPLYLHPQTLLALEAQLAAWGESTGKDRQVESALTIVALRRELHKELNR